MSLRGITMFKRLLRDEAGSPATEFVLVASLVSLAALGAFAALGQQSSNQLGGIEKKYAAVN